MKHQQIRSNVKNTRSNSKPNNPLRKERLTPEINTNIKRLKTTKIDPERKGGYPLEIARGNTREIEGVSSG